MGGYNLGFGTLFFILGVCLSPFFFILGDLLVLDID
jgi:hypothetical protein